LTRGVRCATIVVGEEQEREGKIMEKTLQEQIEEAKRDVRRFYDTDHRAYEAAERRLSRLLAAKEAAK
jgi:hypothetical protein